MKVIVNNFTPLTVEDEEGNVLFQWLPRGKHRYVTEIRCSDLSKEDSENYRKQLENEIFNSMRVNPKYLK